MADIRIVGTSIESFQVDHDALPGGATEGWVPVATLHPHLEPVYVRELPTVDGWKKPLLYWSDGDHYRIVSTGKDGAVDQEWSGEIEAEPTQEFIRDIVFGDGQFYVYPEGTQR